MKCEKIFMELEKLKIEEEYFWRRKLITIKYEHFQEFESYFTFPLKIGTKYNYRTKEHFKHIHAIKNDKYVQFHYDYGNIYKNPLWSVIHLFLDMIPYYLWFLIKLKKPYEMKEK